jgi:outer membrane biosynthesis protein TonB
MVPSKMPSREPSFEPSLDPVSPPVPVTQPQPGPVSQPQPGPVSQHQPVPVSQPQPVPVKAPSLYPPVCLNISRGFHTGYCLINPCKGYRRSLTGETQENHLVVSKGSNNGASTLSNQLHTSIQKT